MMKAIVGISIVCFLVLFGVKIQTGSVALNSNQFKESITIIQPDDTKLQKCPEVFESTCLSMKSEHNEPVINGSGNNHALSGKSYSNGFIVL
jgi:hypothetical protein